ncbi:DUF262 domain-containing protein [uncultured Bacteroides sp.]|uniref:DUF262 domain-containing protein n=1 Tax=uncultured Bacteroides sp. TaxID=162156 RepID=UPI002AABF974|nr:DUF262 domain-containing protein [uncultured Bacteroides sp.]
MNKYNSTYLKDENLLLLLSLNKLIVPEIQREYVWGKPENNNVLERFLSSIKNACETCEKCKQAHKITDINIGFLYSYKPSYVVLENERYLDEFLIDGQQRFTTLFLLLAYLAVKENRIKDFLALVRFDEILEEINFDYKVRNLTHRFLIDLLGSFDKDTKADDIFPIEKQTWFLSDYATDITVRAMLGALDTISRIFSDDFQYFDYILTAVRFWHFKTEVTSQGEELYITMNSRGEKLADNEEQKAQILNLPADKLYKWGQKWETWQDFFWKSRNKEKKHNADKGFNEFVRWIKILESNNNSPTPELVEKYFNVVKYLFKKDGVFKNNFAWLSPETENSQLNLFRLLPVVKFVERFGIDINEREVIRVKHFFKNIARIDNVSKAVNTLLPETIKIINALPDTDISSICQLEKVPVAILSTEEKKKFEIYRANTNNREVIEDIFWKAEEHKIWKGEILPLINWATENDIFNLDKFKQYYQAFNSLFYDELKYPELDITRRALLTRQLKKYPRIFRGNTNYSFCWEYEDWQTLIKDNEEKFGEFLKELFGVNLKHNKLQEMIDKNPEGDYYDEFVKIPELLSFCKQKNIQWDNDTNSWVLIADKKRSGSYANLYVFRLHLELLKQPFWEKEKWTEDFWCKDKTCVFFDFPAKHIAIDIYHYKRIVTDLDTDTTYTHFQLQLFNRNAATDDNRIVVEKVSAKFDLQLKGNRFISEQEPKEKILCLLKKIMVEVENS